MESLGNDDRAYCSGPQVRVVRSYFDNLLRYALSVTFCETAALKVVDQKTHVKCR